MSDDWQVGDLAVCMKRDKWKHAWSLTPANGPAFGEIVRVHSIALDRIMLVLWFEEWPGDRVEDAFSAERFRKVRPDKHEGCEPEFVTLLKRLKRPVAA